LGKAQAGAGSMTRTAAPTSHSACAFEPTRRVAGDSVALHAGFTYVDALTELPCIELLVSLDDASTLLIRILNLLRTRRKTDADSD
jgi:hypothetical protein